MAVPWWVRGTWCGLWLAIAWQSGLRERPDLARAAPPPRARRPARWRCAARLALLALMLAAVWRQAFDPDVPAAPRSARCSLGSGSCTS
jgi:hypothetical protein